MNKPGRNTALFCLITALFSYQSAYCNPLEQIGLAPLRSLYPELTGSGVKVAQPEFYDGANKWQVDPADVGQPQSRFRWISGSGTATTFPNALGDESNHANLVGYNFFGIPGGVAPGIDQIDNYDVLHFVGSIIDANPQPAIPAKIVNQSFIYDGQSSAAEQRFDNYAATYNVLFVSGIGNGDTTNVIKVFPPGTAYNGIGVGAFGGASSFGPTTDGRCKPDITAPSSVTSFSTPYVSGAAALLVQAGNQSLGGSNTNAATDIRTVKALLLNGAVKPSGWTNHPSHPLDMRFGSGVLNVFNSFKQLSGGKQTALERTSHIPNGAHPPGNSLNNLSAIGWDFNTITNNPSNLDRVHHYYFLVPTNGSGHKFTATLTWNRAVNTSSINNLNLFLYRIQSSTLITLSTSVVDNVEHIFVPHLAPGRYNLQVWKSATYLTASEPYALAFEAISTGLSIGLAADNVRLTWPVYPHGFTLESATSLNTPISWTPVAGSPSITDGQYQLFQPVSQPQQFYRLRQP